MLPGDAMFFSIAPFPKARNKTNPITEKWLPRGFKKRVTG